MIRPGRTLHMKSFCVLSDSLTDPERFVETCIKRELEMNYVRYQQIENGLSSISKKILAFVPLSEPWPRHRIASEIERQSRARVDPKTLDGVLSNLAESGLVKEPKRGQYIRLPVPSEEKSPTPALRQLAIAALPQKEITMPIKPTTDTALDKIAQATSSLRQLSKQINETASVIDDAAIASQQESQKMRQLSELLKSINA